MKGLICQNCIHSQHCLFLKSMNGTAPMYCEMHEAETLSIKEMNLNEEEFTKNQHSIVLDLCSNCDKKVNCLWRKEKDFVFDCQEYE